MWYREEVMEEVFDYFNVQDLLEYLLSGHMVNNGSPISSFIFLLFMAKKCLGNELKKNI
jgi:hypothetical protein